MSTEAPRAACSGSFCRNAVIVALLVLLAITTTGWVVTATRDRPVSVNAPGATQEPARQPAPLPPAPGEPAAPEMVEVVVAAKDLPVGTMFTREELKSVVKVKKVPKDGLPPNYVINVEDLIDKRIARPVRVAETFNPLDLVKGSGLTLPEGHNLVSILNSVTNPASGFIGPGSRVNVLTILRKDNKLHAFPLLVNVLVVAVDTQSGYDEKSMTTVSFAVTEKQALLLSLAKTRGCTLELLLRHPNKSNAGDKDYDIDAVIKLLSEEKEQPAIEGAPAPRPVG